MNKNPAVYIGIVCLLAAIFYGIDRYIKENVQKKLVSDNIDTTNLIAKSLASTNYVVCQPTVYKWDRKCPVCKEQNHKSCITKDSYRAWIKNSYNYIDEDGNSQGIDYKRVSEYEYKCTRGHEFR